MTTRSRWQGDAVARTKAYQQALFDAGLAGLTYPVEYGGQGLSRSYQEIFTRESAEFTLPTNAITISHGMCLPILNDFGTDEQKARHLRKIISAEEIWCQMFSEPGAGSDVASLQTRAELDGDEWIINGQKVWTSGAQFCDYGLCLARTDVDVPKHEGISMFIIDMRGAGVDIRPLRQITGDADFNEIFFTDVRIPRSWLVGELNRGWNVAVAMLMYERVALGAGGAGPMASRRFDRLVEIARDNSLSHDASTRQALADFYIRETILRFVGMRIGATHCGRGTRLAPRARSPSSRTAQLAVLGANVAARMAGPAAVAWRGQERRPVRAWRARCAGDRHRRGDERSAAQHHRRARAGLAEGTVGRQRRAVQRPPRRNAAPWIARRRPSSATGFARFSRSTACAASTVATRRCSTIARRR